MTLSIEGITVTEGESVEEAGGVDTSAPGTSVLRRGEQVSVAVTLI